MTKPILFVDESALHVLGDDAWDIITRHFRSRVLKVGVNRRKINKSPIATKGRLLGELNCFDIEDVHGRGKVLVSADPEQVKRWSWHKLDTRELDHDSIVNELQWLAERVNLKFQIELALPPESLHPNKRVFWKAKTRHKSKYSSECILVSRLKMVEQFNESLLLDSAEIQTRWYFRTAAKHDPDNLIAWAKPVFDALTRAGVLADDNNVIHLPPRQQKDAGRPRLEVTVTAL